MSNLGIDPNSLSHLPGMSASRSMSPFSSGMGPSFSSSMGPSHPSPMGPSPFSAPPSIDATQRDYVSRAEMDYMGPSTVRHVQEAARNTPAIRMTAPSYPTIVKKKLKKKAKGGKKR